MRWIKSSSLPKGFLQSGVLQSGVLHSGVLTIRCSYNQGFLRSGVLQSGVLTIRGSYDQGFLQSGVLTIRGLTIGGSYDQGFLQSGVFTIRGSYNQGSYNRGFLRSGVLTIRDSNQRVLHDEFVPRCWYWSQNFTIRGLCWSWILASSAYPLLKCWNWPYKIINVSYMTGLWGSYTQGFLRSGVLTIRGSNKRVLHDESVPRCWYWS